MALYLGEWGPMRDACRNEVDDGDGDNDGMTSLGKGKQPAVSSIVGDNYYIRGAEGGGGDLPDFSAKGPTYQARCPRSSTCYYICYELHIILGP